ncbi:MAG: hypothetical protein EOO47_24745 [Flavobacterium sp.]|nr:MAG: hypothetical protein EOO47_24745 [Flavobacterium sp.]
MSILKGVCSSWFHSIILKFICREKDRDCNSFTQQSSNKLQEEVEGGWMEGVRWRLKPKE